MTDSPIPVKQTKASELLRAILPRAEAEVLILWLGLEAEPLNIEAIRTEGSHWRSRDVEALIASGCARLNALAAITRLREAGL